MPRLIVPSTYKKRVCVAFSVIPNLCDGFICLVDEKLQAAVNSFSGGSSFIRRNVDDVFVHASTPSILILLMNLVVACGYLIFGNRIVSLPP